MISFFLAVIQFLSLHLSQSAFADPKCEVLYANPSLLKEAQSLGVSESIMTQVKNQKLTSVAELAEALEQYELVMGYKKGKPTLVTSLIAPSQAKDWSPIELDQGYLTSDGPLESCDDIKSLKKKLEDSRRLAIALHNLSQGAPIGMSFGQMILELEYLNLERNQDQFEPFNKTLARYNELLNRVKKLSKGSKPETFFRTWLLIVNLLYSDDKENIEYKGFKHFVYHALMDGGSNCEGETALILSLIIDSKMALPKGWILGFESFKDHIRPVLYNASQNQIFDLVYTQVGKPRSAIYPLQALSGLINDEVLVVTHPIEFEQVDDLKDQTLWRKTFCKKGIEDFSRHKQDIFNATGFYGCDYVSENREIKELVDTNSRAQKEITEEQDSDESTVGSVLGKVGDIFSNLIDNKENLNYLINYRKVRPEFTPEEKSLIEQWDEVNSKEIRNKVKEAFSREEIFRRLGLLSIQEPWVEKTKKTLKKRGCLIFEPLQTKETQVFYNGVYFPIDLLADKSHYYNMPLLERYIFAIRTLEEEFEKSIPILKQAFKPYDLKSSLMFQSEKHEEIMSALSTLGHYTKLFDSLSECSDIGRSIDLPEIKKVSQISSYVHQLENVKFYFRTVNDQPDLFLKTVIDLNDGSRPSLRLPVPKNQAINAGLLTLLDLPNDEDLSVAYRGFYDYFLHNPDYFFTAPSDELLEFYGGVRPPNFKQIFVDRAEKNFVEVNLPRVDQACAEGDQGLSLGRVFSAKGEAIGYSGFYIDCGSAENQEDVDYVQQRDGEIVRPQTSQTVWDEHLVVNMNVTEVKREGSPQSHAIRAFEHYETYRDPRLLVLVDLKAWPSLAPLFVSLEDHPLDLVMLHHVQSNQIAGLFDTEFLYRLEVEVPWEMLSTDTLKISRDRLLDLVDQYENGSIRFAKLCNLVKDEVVERLQREGENEVTDPFMASPALQVAYKEFMNERKSNWQSVVAPPNFGIGGLTSSLFHSDKSIWVKDEKVYRPNKVSDLLDVIKEDLEYYK